MDQKSVEKSANNKAKIIDKFAIEKYQKGLSSNWKKLQNKLAEKSKQQSNKNQQKTTRKHKIQKTNSNNANDDSAQKSDINQSKSTKMRKIQSNNAKNGSTEVWFDDVDPCLIETTGKSPQKSAKLTKYLAMDCEMVGCGFNGKHSVLARCSIVNVFGECVYDKFVKPLEKVTDYRTNVSGIRPKDLENGEDFKTVQKEVYDLIKDRILVGHSIDHDLKVLYLSHPRQNIRDTSVFFQRLSKSHKKPSLRFLSEQYLGVKIQDGEHNSIIDAQATMSLFTLFNKNWEKKIAKRKK